MIDIYNYDPITFEYTTQGKASKNPVNPDNPIIPACATTIVPLEHIDKYAIVWVGNKWEYKEDHRGELWYNSENQEMVEITFIGSLPNYYFTPDSPIANKPEGTYWKFDSDKQKWVGDSLLYKQYIYENFDKYWDIKQSTPFEIDGFKYLPSWRDLYDSIFNTLNNGIKKDYRLQDYDGKYNTVNVNTMKPIYVKMADIVDEMYIDKQDLESYFKKEDDFNKLEKSFNAWVKKEYK
jgi:hypothetical protein